MSPIVVLRRRSEEDLPALAAALVRVHALDGYPVEGVDDPSAWLRPQGEIASWVAEASSEPIGQVSLTSATAVDDAARVWCARTGSDAARLALLTRLFVDPDHRSCGAGRVLVEKAVDHARTSGLAVALDVMEKDRAAIRLYESLGARRLGAVTHHHGEGLAEPAAVYAFGVL